MTIVLSREWENGRSNIENFVRYVCGRLGMPKKHLWIRFMRTKKELFVEGTAKENGHVLIEMGKILHAECSDYHCNTFCRSHPGIWQGLQVLLYVLAHELGHQFNFWKGRGGGEKSADKLAFKAGFDQPWKKSKWINN